MLKDSKGQELKTGDTVTLTGKVHGIPQKEGPFALVQLDVDPSGKAKTQFLAMGNLLTKNDSKTPGEKP
jgi:hypothetical protein